MQRIRIAALVLLVMIALATAVAFAATNPPPPPANQSQLEPPDDEADWRDGPGRDGRDEGPGRGWRYDGQGPHRHGHGRMGERRMAFRAANNPSASVLRDVAGLERMYRRSGREKEIPGLWRDVLARTNDPVVRHMAGGRLARLEWRAGNKDAAIEQMKKNLDADLKRLK